MLLTDEQLHEIREIIRDHHTAFVASVISPDAIAPEILERLKEKGLVDVKISSIEDAYLYGQVFASLDDTKGMTYEQFKSHVRRHPVPLTAIEKRAIDMAQHSAGQYAVGLGNKVEQETGNILFEADTDLRAQMRDEIRDLTAENIAKRESVKKLKSNLGWATRDWARDWDRIAVTEKHTAMQRGQADHIAKRYGADARVFKRVEPKACSACRRLYLGPDGHPRIFKLSELEENGSNFGKKQADWLPTIQGTHPWCQCQLSRIPAGWGFDEHGRLSPKGKGGIEYDDEADLELALMQEDDLQKAFKLQGHTEFQGIPIAIENKPGSVRKWTAPDGEGGETRMKYAYGFVKRTRGADEDEIDVFLGPDPRAANVYVIHQQDPKTGRYDEDKAMLGFSSQKLAEAAYQQHYDRPDFLITTSPMSVAHFKRWVKITEPSELFKAGEPTPRLVIPAELFEKAGPYVGPRGGKWQDPQHKIPWKEKKEQKPAKFRYGLRFRPPSIGAIPKGEYAVEKHSDFTHGVIVYNRALTPQEIKSFELEPILGAKDLAKRVDVAVAEVLSDYPDEQRELAEEDPRNFAMMARQAFVDQGPGHIPDIDALVEQVRKKVLESGKPKLSKARVANIIGAASSPAADRAPGQSSAANFAFTVPVKPRPPTVLPEDLMSINDGLEREERIKLDKETFEVHAPFHKEPVMVIIPMSDGIDPDEVKRNRKHLDDLHRGNIGQKNQTPAEAES